MQLWKDLLQENKGNLQKVHTDHNKVDMEEYVGDFLFGLSCEKKMHCAQ